MTRFLARAFEWLASIRLAVLSMAALALACAAATVHESRFGPADAQRLYYSSAWFAALLVLLAANVLFSMLKRWPWTTPHVGFVSAHVGILLILLGSLVTLRLGVDGTLQFQETETKAAIALPTRAIAIALPGWETSLLPIAHSRQYWGEERHELGGGLAAVVTRYEPHVAYHETLADAADGVPALEYHLEGEGLPPQDGSLLADDVERGRASFGPVELAFVTAADDQAAARLLADKEGVSRAVFVGLPGGVVRYALSSRKAKSVSGVVSVGEKVETPWMGLVLVVDRVRPSVRVERHLTAQPPPAQESRWHPALEVRLERGGRAGAARWIAWGEEQELDDGAGGKARASFGDASARLPFQVTLLSFRAEKYPGSTQARSYESRVRVDDPEAGSFERVVAMNQPLHHRGYTFFQSSYAEGERATSILSVSRAPGLPLVYGGTALLVVGIAWMFYVKPWLAKRQGMRALRARRSLEAGRSAQEGAWA
jgi:hypothetical protein